MINVKNMTFNHFIKSYLSYLNRRIEYFTLYRKRYKNYFDVIIHVLKRKYPCEGILRNGKSVLFNHYFEVKNALMGLNYDKENDIMITTLKHTTNQIKLYGCGKGGDITSVFLNEDYRFLPVKENVIIDIGANIGDTSIYFALRGASKVIALEPYPENYELAKKNIEMNDLSNKIDLLLAGCSSKVGYADIPGNNNEIHRIPLMTLESILKSNKLDSSLLKIDCEGCEYETILHTPEEVLRKFSHIQIEYHYGYLNLKEKLENCGFSVSITSPTYYKPFQINNLIKSVNDSGVLNSNDVHEHSVKMFVGMLYAVRN